MTDHQHNQGPASGLRPFTPTFTSTIHTGTTQWIQAELDLLASHSCYKGPGRKRANWLVALQPTQFQPQDQHPTVRWTSEAVGHLRAPLDLKLRVPLAAQGSHPEK